jgi:hypothetical protein
MSIAIDVLKSRTLDGNLLPEISVQRTWASKMCLMDLDKLSLLWWFNFKLEPIFTTTHDS